MDMMGFISWLRERKIQFYIWRKEKKEQFLIWKRLTFPLGKKVYVIGTPNHTNLGDSAIVLAQLRFLLTCGWNPKQIKEITYGEYERYKSWINKLISGDALIAQLGGGNLGNQWMNEELLRRNQILSFPQNPMIVFPQTVFYTDDAFGETEAKKSINVYNGREKLTMVAREQVSWQRMKQLYPDTDILLTPDIVLSVTMETFAAVRQKRTGVLLVMRNDEEKAMDDAQRRMIESFLQKQGVPFSYTDMHCNCMVSAMNRASLVRQKMEEIASAKLVITDRLHGMIFAAITETPCVVFSNYNHKVRGTYEWIKYLPYIRFAESAEDVQKFLPELLAMENCVFDNEPLKPYFEPLAKVVREYADH